MTDKESEKYTTTVNVSGKQERNPSPSNSRHSDPTRCTTGLRERGGHVVSCWRYHRQEHSINNKAPGSNDHYALQSMFGAKQAPEYRTRRPTATACGMHGKQSKASTNYSSWRRGIARCRPELNVESISDTHDSPQLLLCRARRSLLVNCAPQT